MERTWKTSVWLEHWNSLLRDLHDSVSETDGGYVRRHAGFTHTLGALRGDANRPGIRGE